MNDKRILKLDKQFTDIEKEQLKKMLAEQPTGIIVPIKDDVKHLKMKKDIPTVIEYQGRRYILDHPNHR